MVTGSIVILHYAYTMVTQSREKIVFASWGTLQDL